MAWLSRIVAGFLVAALCTTVIATVFDHTLFNAHYLEQKAAKTSSYPRLSKALSDELATKSDDTTNKAQLTASLQTILTPAVLQQKINGGLDQLQAYYKGNGPVPSIDLTGLVAQAQAAGLQIPADNPLNKPITLTSNAQAKDATKKFQGIRTDSLIAVAVAVVLLLVLSWERHRYATLPDIAIVFGILMGIIAVLFTMLPSLVNRYAKVNFSSNAFASIAHDLAASVATDLGKTFGIIAGVFLVVGIVSRILVGRMKPKTPTAPTRPRPTNNLKAKPAKA